MYIEHWGQVPDGATIIEDTYNEVYRIYSRDGKRYITQIGWQVGNKPVPENTERELDFSPNAMYDQPWIRIK